ncbi:hypothetical protein QU38_02175, partial [Staphylococcus aureus]
RRLGLGNGFGGDVEIALVVEGVDDRRRDQRHEAQADQPPDMPDQREADQGADAGQDHARAGVARHVDVLEAGKRTLAAARLHVVPGVEIVDHRREGEIIVRRRRAGRPFQGAAVPGIAGGVLQRLALPDADRELDQHRADAGGDHHRAERGDDEEELDAG